MEYVNATTGKQMLILTWQDVENAIQLLLPSLPFKPTTVLGLARGGTIPASIIHRNFTQAKLRVLTLKSRWRKGKLTKTKPKMEDFDWASLQGQCVLVVDDILDTGDSIRAIQRKIPKDCSVCFATIVSKQPCLFVISAYNTLPQVWVRFPWESTKEAL